MSDPRTFLPGKEVCAVFFFSSRPHHASLGRMLPLRLHGLGTVTGTAVPMAALAGRGCCLFRMCVSGLPSGQSYTQHLQSPYQIWV